MKQHRYLSIGVVTKYANMNADLERDVDLAIFYITVSFSGGFVFVGFLLMAKDLPSSTISIRQRE